MSLTSLVYTWVDSLKSVDPQIWNALVGSGSPFLEWEWLRTLELAGCLTPQLGWQPRHLLVHRGKHLVAAAPLYLKGHSYGEFVFDQAWADAAQRLRLRYYPKLLGATPFTPATGYRFLIHPSENPDTLMDGMFDAIDSFCHKNQLLIASFLYIEPEERERFTRRDCLERITHNYQWTNNAYQCFDDFLNSFNANQRRNIRRERAALQQEGITFQAYSGKTIPAGMFNFMYDLYCDTCNKFMWGSKYLNRRFFKLLEECFAERTVFIAGERNGDVLGMAFNIHKQEQMFGRYWGCTEEVKFLHFSTCYYQPVETAISLGVQVFDPGAGGQFKMRRGFAATENYSMHRIYHPRFAQALEEHLKLANRAELEQIVNLNNDLPLKAPVEQPIHLA